MRLPWILLLVLAVCLMSFDLAQAQFVGCNTVPRIAGIVKIDNTRGKPGDTILVPYSFQNPNPCVAFNVIFTFDTTKLRPVELDDTVLDVRPGARLPMAHSALLANYYTDRHKRFRRDAVATLWSVTLPGPGQPFAQDTIPAGGPGPLFYIPFVVQPGLRHLVDTANFNFFQENNCYYDTSGGIEVAHCTDGCIGADFDEAITVGSIVFDSTVYPSLTGLRMFFVTDTNPQPPVVSFSVSTNQVTDGVPDSLTFTYACLNADSVGIFDATHANAVVMPYTTTTSGTKKIKSPISTTRYRITAWKAALSTSDSVNVTVSSTGTGTAPTVSTGSQTFTVKEGETVSFVVTATDPDAGDIITLATSSLPTNASFGPTNPRVGASPVSGTFSFTPTTGQKGTYSVVFTAQDTQAHTTTYVVTVIVEALQFDRLFSTSAPGQTPVGGLRGSTGIQFPVNLISAQTVYGIQFDMAYPRTDIRIDSIKPSSRIPEFAVYDNIGVTPGNIRVVTFGLNNEVVQTDTTTAVLYLYCTIDSAAIPWTNEQMRMANGRESVTPDPNKPSLPLVTDSGIIQVDNPGDVNLDQIIDVGDVVNIVAYIIGNYPLSPRQFATADIIVNDSVNVFDLVGDLNIIYGLPVSPAPPIPPAQQASVALAYNNLYSGQTDVMKVHSELPTEIAGVQLEVDYDPSSVTVGKPTVTQDYRNFVLQYRDNGQGRLKILLYHGAGGAANPTDLIQEGAADLVNIPITARNTITSGNKSQLRLTQALLATPGAASVTVTGVDLPLPTSFILRQNYPNPFNPTTKIEFSVSGTEGASARNVSLEIYNVLGQKVKTLLNEKMTPGTYTLEWNATTDAGTRVSSGVYLYRLVVDAQSQTRKMMFLK